MKLVFFLVAVFCFAPAMVSAGEPVRLGISRSPEGWGLHWTTRAGFNYQLEQSGDQQEWMDTGVVESGTGATVSCNMEGGGDSLFYRVREAFDLYNGGFLTLSVQEQEGNLSDGVCFAFDLNVFPQLPSKIRIYRGSCAEDGSREQIGLITDFDEIDGVKFVRGSVIWLPGSEGEYEVQVVVIDDAGAVMASTVRQVIIGMNEAPVILVSGGPDTPSRNPQPAWFQTDPSEDVRRVEFYDNGVFFGFDVVEPFGDHVEDLQGLSYYLMRGVHEITAIAYDVNDAMSESPEPYVVDVTEGNARPQLELISPEETLSVVQGETFAIQYDVDDDDGLEDVAGVMVSRKIVQSNPGSEEALTSDFVAPFEELTVDTSDWEPGTHLIKVFAMDSTANIDPVNFHDTTGKSYPHYFTVYVRSSAEAQFASALVANIVDEASATPTNEVFRGIEASSGEFHAGLDSGLQMEDGILLTTGLFSLWDGGDDGVDQDGEEKIWLGGGDFALKGRITGSSTEDAVVLEFDVFCAESQLELVYQFGSEEYDEFVGFYNDAFMVTVDGALVTFVPDCTDIVAVNSVNNGNLSVFMDPANPHLYLDDEEDIDPSVAPENQYRQVEYDGMTIRLRAHVFVEPNTTHRIRLVIADVNDGRLDSGLFVSEGSVRTVKPVP